MQFCMRFILHRDLNIELKSRFPWRNSENSLELSFDTHKTRIG